MFLSKSKDIIAVSEIKQPGDVLELNVLHVDHNGHIFQGRPMPQIQQSAIEQEKQKSSLLRLPLSLAFKAMTLKNLALAGALSYAGAALYEAGAPGQGNALYAACGFVAEDGKVHKHFYNSAAPDGRTGTKYDHYYSSAAEVFTACNKDMWQTTGIPRVITASVELTSPTLRGQNGKTGAPHSAGGFRVVDGNMDYAGHMMEDYALNVGDVEKQWISRPPNVWSDPKAVFAQIAVFAIDRAESKLTAAKKSLTAQQSPAAGSPSTAP
ncbi:MAG: hypothetical protein DI551_02240 [Micavibrio aeruginosavorus]|uniref:Uncharacterized protein n=1 Tax=Micavibrio aeruginosavorus TaxID=349221 RepID=A0A2W5N3Q2_9BACT|nr:MAG: hypothetical protein DI551_02240 [Micavibrio aeruginosavorus]